MDPVTPPDVTSPVPLPGDEEIQQGYSVLQDLLGSQGDARDLTHQQVPLLRKLFEEPSGTGLWLFTYHVCGCQDITPHLHYEICQFLSRWGWVQLQGPEGPGEWVQRSVQQGEIANDSWRRLMLCIPRDCFKTTVATRSNALWQASLNPEITIGIFNEAEAKVKSWLGSIRDVVEGSRLYQALWPHVLPRGVHWKDQEKGVSRDRSWKWGESGLKFVRESRNVSELTFEPFGIGGASTGKHFTHVIKDDIIGETSASSQAVMEDAIEWLDHARALERPADQGCELFNFTRWAYHDAYSHTLKKWPDDYKVYHRALLSNPETRQPDVVDGTSIFPERFPTPLCKSMYKSDAFVFYSQRQCIPKAGRETSFSDEWLRYGEIEWTGDEPYFLIEPEFHDPGIMDPDLVELGEDAPNLVPLYWMERAVILDPAPQKKSEMAQERRARNGLVALGRDPWGRLFIFEAVPLRADPVDVLSEVIRLCRRYLTNRISIEEVNFSKIYEPLWGQIIRLDDEYEGFEPEWVPVAPEGQDKNARITSMMGPHRKGFVYYNREGTDHIISELLEYPHSETRDLIDAEAYAGKACYRPESPGEAHEARYRRYARDRDLGRTGYGDCQASDEPHQ